MEHTSRTCQSPQVGAPARGREGSRRARRGVGATPGAGGCSGDPLLRPVGHGGKSAPGRRVHAEPAGSRRPGQAGRVRLGRRRTARWRRPACRGLQNRREGDIPRHLGLYLVHDHGHVVRPEEERPYDRRGTVRQTASKGPRGMPYGGGPVAESDTAWRGTPRGTVFIDAEARRGVPRTGEAVSLAPARGGSRRSPTAAKATPASNAPPPPRPPPPRHERRQAPRAGWVIRVPGAGPGPPGPGGPCGRPGRPPPGGSPRPASSAPAARACGPSTGRCPCPPR